MVAATTHAEDVLQPAIAARPLDRIVVGVDFSEVSLAAAQWVGRHLAPDAAVTLVHVIEPPPSPNVPSSGSGWTPGLPRRWHTRIESLRGALHGLSGIVGGTRTTVEIRVGDPAVQLAACADMADADLVVVGGNAVSRAAPRHETATTDRLLRRLARPGLVARNAQAAPTTVLAAVADGDEEPVLAVARMVGAPSAARVTTLRLADARSLGSRARAEYPPRETRIGIEPRDAGTRRQQARTIIEVARKRRADVIVVGRDVFAPGNDDDAALMLARTAPCSVLVVASAYGRGEVTA